MFERRANDRADLRLVVDDEDNVNDHGTIISPIGQIRENTRRGVLACGHGKLTDPACWRYDRGLRIGIYRKNWRWCRNWLPLPLGSREPANMLSHRINPPK